MRHISFPIHDIQRLARCGAALGLALTHCRRSNCLGIARHPTILPVRKTYRCHSGRLREPSRTDERVVVARRRDRAAWRLPVCRRVGGRPSGRPCEVRAARPAARAYRDGRPDGGARTGSRRLGAARACGYRADRSACSTRHSANGRRRCRAGVDRGYDVRHRLDVGTHRAHCRAADFAFFIILLGHLAKRRTQSRWQALRQLNGHFYDVLSGLVTLKWYNRSRVQADVIARVGKLTARRTV